MNCKPGDSAFVIAADNVENVGRVVEVLRPFPYASNAWVVLARHEPAVTASGLSWEPWFYDCELLPIRPGDLEDETPTVRELEVA